jgi:alpha-L-fucosidase
VYGTQGGPFKANKNYAATRKDNRIYIHLFNQDTTALLLPAIPGRQVKQVHFLKGADLKFSQSAQGITVALPAAFPDKNVSVIVLEMDGNTAAIEVID